MAATRHGFGRRRDMGRNPAAQAGIAGGIRTNGTEKGQ